MKISIGNSRELTLKRAPDGEWRGAGFGLRMKLTQVYGRNSGYGTKWRCRVYGTEVTRQLLATCLGHTLKWTAQEGARLADVELTKRIQLTPQDAEPRDDNPLYQRYLDDCDAKNRE